MSVGHYGLLHWDLDDGSAEVIDRGPWDMEAMMKLSPNGRFVAVVSKEVGAWRGNEGLKLYDLDEGTSRVFHPHGARISSVAFDPTSDLIVTGNLAGEIRVGPVTGEEPHLLLGHEALVLRLAVSPDGRWLASTSFDHTVRIWPMPNMKQLPLHALPYEELLERLRSLTNLRAVPDEESPTGYKIEIGPFPGWETVPEW
jgi:WD40 repeat protein